MDEAFVKHMEDVLGAARVAEVELGSVRFNSTSSLLPSSPSSNTNNESSSISSCASKHKQHGNAAENDSKGTQVKGKKKKKKSSSLGGAEKSSLQEERVGIGGGGSGGGNCFWVCGAPDGGVKSQQGPQASEALRRGRGGMKSEVPHLGGFLLHSNSLLGGTFLHCAAL